MSCHLISFFDCEMFLSRSVSRVPPRDLGFAGYLKMSNINIEAWFWDLVPGDRCRRFEFFAKICVKVYLYIKIYFLRRFRLPSFGRNKS